MGSTRLFRLTSHDAASSLARMSTIRDVVQALGGREGVDAVILMGRDGLTIDSHVSGNLETDSVSALVPSVVDACNRLGMSSGRDTLATGVIEYSNGMAVIAQLTPETLLAVLVKQGANVGNLLYDLRRHRVGIANLL